MSKGRTKALIDRIIEERSGGNPMLTHLTKAKMCMKGIFPEDHTEYTQDDESVIKELTELAKDLKIKMYASEVMTLKPLYSKQTDVDVPTRIGSARDVKTIYTTKENISDALRDLKRQLRGFEFKMMIFFASSCFDPDILAKEMDENFRGVSVFGGTTAGEIINGKVLRNSIVAMAFSPDMIEDVSVQIVENIKEDGDVSMAFNAFEDFFKEPASKMDFKRYLGLILIDGLSQSEEKILDRVGDKSNVMFVGGSTADDLNGRKTHIFYGGRAYTNAAMLVLIKPRVGFSVLKTQSFNILNRMLTATKVNEEKREVIEFNGRPAALAYAEALGVSPLEITKYFNTNPFGLISDGELFVRNPAFLVGDSITFYCRISKGSVLRLLSSRDIVSDTRKEFEEKKLEMKNISAIIDFQCCFRFLNLEQKNAHDEYGRIFGDIPNIGFATIGESYVGHLNQTSVIVLFE